MGVVKSGGDTPPWGSLLFWFSAGLAALVLRLGAAGLLIWRHGIEHGFEAWHGLWHEAPWPLADGVAQLGLPWPSVLAATAVVVGLAGCVLWVAGLLTRLASIGMMTVLSGFAIYFWLAGDTGSAELAGVYFLIAASLFVMGGGPLSLDLLFRRKPKKPVEPERRPLVTPAPSRGRGWLG